VRLELAIDKFDPLDFGFGVDNESQLRTAVDLYLSHQTQPPKRTREGRFSPSPLRSILQYGVDLLKPDLQANFGQVLVPPSVSVVILDVGTERSIPTVQRTVVDVVHIHTEGQALVLLLQSAGRNDVQIAVEAAILLQANAVGFFSAPGINPVPSELVNNAANTIATDKQLAVAAVLEQHLAELLELVFVQGATGIVVLGLDEAQQAARSAALVGGVLVPLAKQQSTLDVQPVLQSLVPAQTSTLVLAGLQSLP